jgi:hypothetical protein
MKKVLILMVVMIILISSCAPSPYKKRKKCRGNGSWYGNRNLGLVIPNNHSLLSNNSPNHTTA